MTPKISLALGEISISGLVVGAGFGIHHFTKERKEDIRKTISEWLGNKVVIPDNDQKSSIWDGKWKTFKAAYSKETPDSNWKIDNWDTNKESGEGLKAFKKLCENNVKKTVDKKSKLINEVIKNCVEE